MIFKKDREETGMMKLSDEQIEQELRSLQGWTREDDLTIVKKHHFREFLTGIRFVNEVARIAQELNHHPSIHVEYTEVTLHLSTHDAKGLTELDFRSAAQYDAAFEGLLHE
jgi:4a-hydroxytetrahydrobiopterin dehydratase